MTTKNDVLQSDLRRSAALARCFALAIALFSASPAVAGGDSGTRAGAQTANSQIAEGEAIAHARCGVCHAVSANDESPTWVNANTPFRALSDRFPIPMLQEALSSGLISGHDEMPGFQFSMDEIVALIAYIDSFAPQEKRYLTSPVQR
jgi:mono/diheme cytochrome c family protein